MKSLLKFQKLKNLWMLGVVVVLVTACGGRAASSLAEPTSGAVFESAAEAPAAAPAPEMDRAAGGEYAESEIYQNDIDDALTRGAVQPQARVIIYTGDMSLVVKDTEEAIASITTLAEEKGGYVAGANVYQSGDVPRGQITIRVPAELYQETMAELRALAVRVERESASTQDVTEEFVDLEARKTNLEVTETALQELLDERRRVGNTSDILEVYRELTNIRGQIEQIEGRLRYLTNQATLSTITIELIPDVLYQPVSVAGWEPQGVAKEALQALVATLQGFVNIAIWLVIFGLPVLIILLIPVVVVILIIRWWLKRRKAKKQTPAEKTD